ncbi:hypothetical protein D3C83_12120 [compost metagenome]
MKLTGAIAEQVFDQLLQFYTVVAQNFGYFALPRQKLADHLVGQQLRSFAHRRERRLELVGNMAQKAVFLFLQVEQPASHPVQALAQILQVLRSAHIHR